MCKYLLVPISPTVTVEAITKQTQHRQTLLRLPSYLLATFPTKQSKLFRPLYVDYRFTAPLTAVVCFDSTWTCLSLRWQPHAGSSFFISQRFPVARIGIALRYILATHPYSVSSDSLGDFSSGSEFIHVLVCTLSCLFNETEVGMQDDSDFL
jgi:hypothetical protein